MNPLSQIAIDLKQMGYPQDLRIGDMTFSAQGNQYIEFRGDMNILGPNWVKVPSLVNIQNQLKDFNYKLTHSSSPDGIKESWQVEDSAWVMQDENVWVVMAKYWEFKKGK